MLHLIRWHRGKSTWALLTQVRDRQPLTKAAALYPLRGGEEVFYRSSKQTLARRQLLIRTAGTCGVECPWTWLGLRLLGLLTVARGGHPKPWSAAVSRQVLRKERSPRWPWWPLAKRFAPAVRDE